ncbi:glycosyltransferase family 4 protein [Nocardioides dongxiaopingii]|uniref:glycosyltransferase family 4 protein n=1 Tax=Nocardioides dongxiaopingii TaxID=2576036 RepID=UPI0010C76730|nr:glycosyltransferase family 4 protein [Nocardioides dongxiaopingii]
MHPRPPRSASARPTVLMGHHTPDVYGSDLQMLESVSALVERGTRVLVTLPGEGPLSPLLRERGAEIVVLDVPVLRKSSLTPVGLLTLAARMARRLPAMVRLLRREQADAVYVNTLTVPLWLVAGRVARRPTLCHVHEAQDSGPRLLRAALAAPLLLADRVLVNSEASRRALAEALPPTVRRASVVYNGVAGPPSEPAPAPVATDGPARVAMVGRLSPRKGTDLLVEAVARLVAEGRDVALDLAGTVFAGYEWFEEELRARAGAEDLRGRVAFHGYLHPVWDLLAGSTVVVVPSRHEPFGNTAVEAQLSGRPVVVAGVQGLTEIVTDGETGLVVPGEDVAALAAAIGRLLDDPVRAASLGADGRRSALKRFGTDTYRTRIADEIGTLVAR